MIPRTEVELTWPAGTYTGPGQSQDGEGQTGCASGWHGSGKR